MDDILKRGKNFQYENTFFERPGRYGGIYLFQSGEVCCERGYEEKAHMQICHEVSYIISGKGDFQIDGITVPVQQGSLFFNRTGTVHSIQVSNAEKLRYVYVGFTFHEDPSDFIPENIISFFKEAVYRHITVTQNQVSMIFRMIDELYNKKEYYEKMLENYGEQMLISLYRLFKNQAVQPYRFSQTEQATESSAYVVIRYIHDNIYTIGSIKEIADELGYSYTYLSHMFKNKMGMPLQRYISNKKIEMARELLARDRYTITQVSEILNYDTVQSFYKSFKRTVGLAPSHYIKKQREK